MSLEGVDMCTPISVHYQPAAAGVRDRNEQRFGRTRETNGVREWRFWVRGGELLPVRDVVPALISR